MANPLAKVIMNNIANKSLKREYAKEKISVNLQQKEEALLIGLIHKNEKVENLRDKGFSTKEKEKLEIITLSQLAAKTNTLQGEEEKEDKGALSAELLKGKEGIESRSFEKLKSYTNLTSLEAVSKGNLIK